MKKTILFLLAGFCFYQASSQLTASNRETLQNMEDSMKTYAYDILQARNVEARFNADSIFTRMLVRALQVKGSFYYPFDSLATISRLSPTDSSFKIFTWQLVIDESRVRQHGAIQMKTNDGSLKLFPLIDKASLIENIEDTITSNLSWVGAVYYQVVEKKAFGNKVYTLLGYDENDLNSNRKIIETLSFDNGRPVFGGGYFSFPDNALQKKAIARYVMEYKKNAGPRLTYDPDMDMIVYEHLISETGEPGKKYTYIPDGDYEGLKWNNGKWVHVNKIFDQVTPEGQPPVPNPLESGGILNDKRPADSRPPKN